MEGPDWPRNLQLGLSYLTWNIWNSSGRFTCEVGILFAANLEQDSFYMGRNGRGGKIKVKKQNGLSGMVTFKFWILKIQTNTNQIEKQFIFDPDTTCFFYGKILSVVAGCEGWHLLTFSEPLRAVFVRKADLSP